MWKNLGTAIITDGGDILMLVFLDGVHQDIRLDLLLIPNLQPLHLPPLYLLPAPLPLNPLLRILPPNRLL
jgi:hypothetical protein